MQKHSNSIPTINSNHLKTTRATISRPPLLQPLLLLSVLLLLAVNLEQISASRKTFFERPGILTRHILEARGYLANDFHIRSEDGYMLRITRGRNPLINGGAGGLLGRVPILFIHGILESFNVWVVNSFNVRPRDLSNLTLSGVPIEELNARLGDFPSAKSLPLLAMDFGHEVFILSRRGFPGSQRMDGNPAGGGSIDDGAGKHVRGPLSAFFHGLTSYGHLAEQIRFSLDRKFWNFSIDEQAKYDFPQVVRFVREHTKRDKVAVVAHSLGGAITLMSLSLFPELNEQLSAVIMWSQAFSVGNGDLSNLGASTLGLLKAYVGPMPPAYSVAALQGYLDLMCSNWLVRNTLCNLIGDSMLGVSAGLAPMRPEFINSLLYTSSSHELAQAFQNVPLGGQMHHYARHLRDAKPYNLSRVTNTQLSFYSGPTDALVSPSDNHATLPKLSVPYRYHAIKSIFNHNSFFYHINCSRLAVIPSLKDIHELSEMPRAQPQALMAPLDATNRGQLEQPQQPQQLAELNVPSSDKSAPAQ